MDQRVQDILKKINYIEADIEIHKQILFSLSSNNQSEMEHVIKIITGQKEDINALRLELQHISPKEHENIITLENAVNEFKKIASKKKFTSINVLNAHEECCLHLKNKATIHCLAKACDEDGGWTIITIDGKIQHFPKVDIDERREDTSPC